MLTVLAQAIAGRAWAAWELVSRLPPIIRIAYPQITQVDVSGNTADFRTDAVGELWHLRFTWTDPPPTLGANETGTVHFTAQLLEPAAPTRFVGRGMWLAAEPCATCAQPGGVGVGYNLDTGRYDFDDQGDGSFALPAPELPSSPMEEKVEVVLNEGNGQGFSLVAIYVYRWGTLATPTSTATRMPATPTVTATATRTQAIESIACGERVEGTLGPGDDEQFYNDGTWADLRTLHLSATAEVTVSMEADGYDAYVGIYDAADRQPRGSGFSTVTVTLPAGDYLVAANNAYPLSPADWPYTLRVDCVGEETATPTATQTRTRTASATATARSVATPTRVAATTPTVSATPTATIGVCPMSARAGDDGVAAGPGCPSPDLIADRIEVVQTIQDLNNSVRLVAGKPTFVRFHVHSSAGTAVTSALLEVQRNDLIDTVRLKPLAPTTITVRPNPQRAKLDDAFLFKLDSDLTEPGGITLKAILNPDNRPFELERDRGNNMRTTTVSFEDVRPMRLVLYEVWYKAGGNLYVPRPIDSWLLTSWLKRVYPISDLQVCPRTMSYPYSNPEPLALPRAEIVNAKLLTKAAWDLTHRIGSPSEPTACQLLPGNTHYYGMWLDEGFRVAGGDLGGGLGFPEAVPFVGGVGSAPTGIPGHWEGYAWDADDSFGDFVGAHEIGHSYNLFHTGYCSDVAPPFYYPYPGGYISPVLRGDDAIYGFDPAMPLPLLPQHGPPAPTQRAIYGPDWKDFMSYCPNVWISDFHYHALLEKFRRSSSGASRETAGAAATDQPMTAGLFNPDWLVVVGSFDPDTGEAVVNPLFVFPDASELAPRVPGDYAIVLRAAAGAELVRYPFTPHEIHERPGPLDPVFFAELVPYVGGTAQVDIEGPSGPLYSVRAGENTPAVHVTTPNGGEVLDGDTITVAWTADDADGDSLIFNVEYSTDHGRTWELVEQNITEHSLALQRVNVAGSNDALVRVWVSDGIHSSFDTSDATFTVRNAVPDVQITDPADGTVVPAGHTVTLEASATDLDAGTLAREQMHWLSSIDGELGTGTVLITSRLSQGRHTITFRADDGDGGIATDTVTVTVVRDTECPGDCDGDGAVAIAELVTGVNMALGTLPLAACPAFDLDGSGAVGVHELVAAVNAALGGC